MESDSSVNYSYEDDFEVIDSAVPQISTKVSMNTNSPAVNKIDYRQRSRYQSHEATKSPSRTSSNKRLGKSTFKTAEKENHQLRAQLNVINTELSRIVGYLRK